jgi:hypothetical protein
LNLHIHILLKRSIGTRVLLCALLFNSVLPVQAQAVKEQNLINGSNSFNRSRFTTVVISEAAVATLATIGLQYLWYKNFPRSRFHFFNDNAEWLNMDKVGHATTAYNVSAIQYNIMRWCGVKNNTSILVGGLTGLAYLTMIEISDGFSAEWGFSKGDMAANIMGTALFMGQQYGWGEQKVELRFSYHKSIFTKYNPSLLGNKLSSRLLKDYDGQTYWLSFNLSSFMPATSKFPKWINADLGYGADGMVGARTNPTSVNGKEIPSYVRQRKLLFAPGFAFNRTGFPAYPSWNNIFRIPAPALEWKLKTNAVKGYFLYY